MKNTEKSKHDPDLFMDTLMSLRDIEAEKCLLGSMLLTSSQYREVEGILPSDAVDAFMLPEHGVLWSTLWSIYENGWTIDLPTVRDVLQLAGRLPRVGGVEYIVHLVENVPTHLNAPSYAQIISDLWNQREAMLEKGEVL